MNDIPQIVLENPFRMLGVFVNSPQKEIVANQGKANAFLKVGKTVEYPLDLNALMPQVNRTVDVFSQASANLTIAKERLKYAQFWFLKMTPLDDVAFNHLYAGNLQQAIEIWDKKDCISSLQNKIITNFIALNLEEAVNTAEDLYEQFSDEFLKATDSTGTLNLTKDDLIHSFIDTLCAEYEPKRIYDIVSSNNWKDYLGGRTTKPLIDKIKEAIKAAKEVDKKEADANLKAGRKLWKNTKDDFAQLKKILPPDDMQLESIADKLGLQILQCGINYYNNSDDDDAAETAMKIQKTASKIVMGEMAKERCEDNLNVLKRIIATLPPKEIRKEHKAIMAEIEITIIKSPSIASATSLLKNTKPYLQTIKNTLGSDNSDYLKISSLVISTAMRIVVEDVNEAQENAHEELQKCHDDYLSRIYIIKNLTPTIKSAWDATLLMDEFDIESDFKSHYNQNRNALKSMCSDLGISTTSPTISSSSSSTSTTSTRASTTSTIPRTKIAAVASTPKPTTSSPTSRSYSSSSSSSSSYTNNSSSNNKKEGIGFGGGVVVYVIVSCLFGVMFKGCGGEFGGGFGPGLFLTLMIVGFINNRE